MPAVTAAVARLESWLETMRGPGGYGGPVAHWWQQSLLYTGPGLDWRYEGVIIGYLHLWAATGHDQWLKKAARAGDDLVKGQLEDGHYPASNFELNPASGGTPHEAAADVGLLHLALATKTAHPDLDWKRYASAAKKNLESYYIRLLWDNLTRSFRDDPDTPSFVPNKAATASEAFFLLAELDENPIWVEEYALPNLDRIIEHQVLDDGELHGAIAQNSFGARVVEKYFPKYIARCVPTLMQGYRWTGKERYADAALDAMAFIARYLRDDGSLPTVVYGNGRMNLWPSWIAPLADVLRAVDTVRVLGFDDDFSSVHERLVMGQDETGGIRTATGFAAQSGGTPPSLPDIRDVLHVVGWCDKAFRYLASHFEGDWPEDQSGESLEVACTFRGQTMTYRETPEVIEISRRGEIQYLWRKGDSWPLVATDAFWLR